MGAIAGVLYPEFFPVSYASRRALDVLEGRSRGDLDTYLFKNLEMGSRGEKVGHNEHKTTSLVLDGAISNQAALAKELKQAGFKTEGLSLPNLLIRSYEHWGDDFAKHIQGAFAIALFDQKKQTLVLVRDRLGIKPLYWSYHNGYLIFASELKAVLATGLVPQAPAEDSIGAFLFLGYIPQDMSPIEHVNKLLPGHFLRLGRGGDLKVASYWSYSSLLGSNITDSPDEIAHKLDALLKEAVSPPKEPVGFLATGSIGSAAVSRYLEMDAPDRTTGYSINFTGEEEQDLHTNFPVKPVTLSPSDFLDELIPAVWRLDEPTAGPMAISIFRLCQQSHENIDTLFTSAGYAEILAAHPRYQATHGEASHPRLQKLTHWLLPILRKIDKKRAFRLLRSMHTKPWLSDYIVKQALFPPSTLREMSPEVSRIFDPDIFIQRFYDLADLGDTPSAHLFLDTRTHLSDRLLLQYDRLTAPFDLSWSSPFLNESVVEYMAQVPEHIKLSDEGPLRKIIPGDTFQHSPIGSPKFLSSWKYDASIQTAFKYLETGTLVEAGWISRRWLRQALHGKTTPPSTFYQLWSILALEVWFRLYINFPIETRPPGLPLIQLLQMG